MTGTGFDVVVVGASFAGATAALQLGRASRRVLMIDAGMPRNRFSPAAHGVPGWDGSPPGDIAGPMPNVNLAVADGTLAGIGVHQSLVFPGAIEPVAQDQAA